MLFAEGDPADADVDPDSGILGIHLRDKVVLCKTVNGKKKEKRKMEAVVHWIIACCHLVLFYCTAI